MEEKKKKKIQLFQTKEQEVNNGLMSIIKKNYFSIPVSIKVISFSLFLLILWRWLGADAFFSIYIERIVDNVLRVSIIGAIFPLSRLLFSLPIGELNDNTDRKQVIFLSKILYALCWILFFIAGMLNNPRILLIAVAINGMASTTLFITYETYIRTHTDKFHTENSRWLYFSSLNAWYVLGAIICAFLIQWVDLPFLYLFIVVFSLLSIITDRKIPFKKNELKKMFGKQSFLEYFLREVFSWKPFKKTYKTIKTESQGFFYSLGFERLRNILQYTWFLFIPLIALQNNLWLTEIVLLFWLMRLPYLFNLFITERSQRFNKKLFIAIILLFLSLFYMLLAFDLSFVKIMIISFGIAFWLSIMRPVIAALISERANQNNAGSITGVQLFVSGIWWISGSIGFGIISSILGMQKGFLLMGISLFVLAIRGITKKTIQRRKQQQKKN
jgi:MFS family permease